MKKISCLAKKSLKTIAYLIFSVCFVLAGSQAGCAAEREEFDLLRERMVDKQIIARGIRDSKVIKAMRKVPRHFFVPDEFRDQAYSDYPLPIGEGQTISQPYIVAYMTEAIDLKPGDRVLEIGTGSGYQAAILAELAAEVYTIEIIPTLGKRAHQILEEMRYKNVWVKIGDGYEGWPEKAPFDAIIVTCAPEEIPKALVKQLKNGGRMIIPVGRENSVQSLIRAVKKGDDLEILDKLPVRFVPMVKGNP
jgi:protein-L-isoaspartate(D-aspartate) O-methyltransferase